MSDIGAMESIVYKLDFSEDLYFAYLSIQKNSSKERVSSEAILNLLKKHNVVYGIDHFTVAKLEAEDRDVHRVEIARGECHVDGVDSKIEYKFEPMDSRPKINEDGSIDFKNIDKYVSVEAGRILATKTLPSAGKNGINVFGKIVLAKQGALKNFNFGKNVAQSEDGCLLLATKNGSVELVGEKISVLDILEIVGDVGPKTGNINFSGKVTVHGNVLSGYSIKAHGDIVVNGIIDGAQIYCEGNLIVYYGIQGQGSAKLEVKGDVIAKFINHASLFCGGDIRTTAIVHSNVKSDGKIELKNNKALIVGGNVYAKMGIHSKQLGTEIGVKTNLSVGLTQDYIIRRANLKKQLSALEENIDKLLKLSTLLQSSSSAKIENADEQINKVNYSLENEKLKRDALKQEQADLDVQIKQMKKAFVRGDLIYSGVCVIIDSVKYEVDETKYRTDIKMTMGEIYLTNY